MTLANPPERLRRVAIQGFRSLVDVDVELGDVTVLIGPNGAGKSNLLSALRMVALMRTQSLRRFVAEQGGASALLHYGPSVTREIEVKLTYDVGGRTNGYEARLGYAAGDALLFLDEVASYHDGSDRAPHRVSLGAGHTESLLRDSAVIDGGKTENFLDRLLSRTTYYHFHDTSPTSPLRQNARPAADQYLRSDGSNLAAFLYRLRMSPAPDAQAAWRVFSDAVRSVAPFIKELQPAPVDPDLSTSPRRLFWVDERDHRFDVHDLSDGTLRAISLFAALTQPSSTLPKFVSIDEPELGLHPAAVATFAGLVRAVAPRCQVLLSTQSPALLDHFDPEQVLVTERHNGETSFRRLDAGSLEAWLDNYSLADFVAPMEGLPVPTRVA